MPGRVQGHFDNLLVRIRDVRVDQCQYIPNLLLVLSDLEIYRLIVKSSRLNRRFCPRYRGWNLLLWLIREFLVCSTQAQLVSSRASLCLVPRNCGTSLGEFSFDQYLKGSIGATRFRVSSSWMVLCVKFWFNGGSWWRLGRRDRSILLSNERRMRWSLWMVSYQIRNLLRDCLTGLDPFFSIIG